MKLSLYLKCIALLLLFTFSSLTNGNHLSAQKITEAPKPPVGHQQLAEDLLAKEGKNGAAPFYSVNTQVNTDAGNVLNDFVPVVAVYQDTVYIAWSVPLSGAIYFSRSTDGGLTFSAALKINDVVSYPPSFSVYGPDLAIDASGHIYIVWHDYRAWASDTSLNSPIEVYLDKSTDGGLTWASDIQITNGSGSYPWHFQAYLDIHRSTGNIYVSFSDYDRWQDSDFGDVSMVRSTDGGLTFAPKIRVDDTPTFSQNIQLFSNIAVDQNSGNVYIVFHDDRNGNRDIYLAKSIDAGQSFATNTKVNSINTNNQEEAAIAIDPQSGDIFVAWRDWRDDLTPDLAPFDNHIFLAKSTDAAATFMPDVKVTDQYMHADGQYNNPPDLGVDTNGIVYLIWHDSREGYANVYYDQSLDGGLTWANDMMVNDDLTVASHALPRLFVDADGTTYLTWMYSRNVGTGNWDIYFGSSGLESCATNLSVDGPDLNGNFQAAIALLSSGTVASTVNVSFRAGVEIRLNPNFNVAQGAQFEVEIGACNP